MALSSRLKLWEKKGGAEMLCAALTLIAGCDCTHVCVWVCVVHWSHSECSSVLTLSHRSMPLLWLVYYSSCMFSVWAFYSPMLSLDICDLNLLILIFLLRYKILKFSTNGSRTPSLIWQFHHSVHSAYHMLPKRWSCLSLGFLGLFFFLSILKPRD